MFDQSHRQLSRNALIVCLASVAVIAALTYLTPRAVASVPQLDPLTYTGVITNNGVAFAGDRDIKLSVCDQPSGGTCQCQTGSALVPVDSNGRFKILLPATCVAALRAAQEPYIDVLVSAASIGRVKVGAVPYAIESVHSANSDTVALVDFAGGPPATPALKTRTFTIDNAMAPHPATPVILNWGYGSIPAAVTILGVKVVSGLRDGCEVTFAVNQVHASASPRIIVTINGGASPACSDVGVLTFSYVYLE